MKWTRDLGETVGGDRVDLLNCVLVAAAILAGVSLGLVW